MRNLISLLISLSFISLSAQSTIYCFSYDNAGNQTSIEICLNPHNSLTDRRSMELFENSVQNQDDFMEKEEIREIVLNAAPNEVVDLLTITWHHYEDNPLVYINLISPDMRVLVENSKIISSQEVWQLYFSDYPPGMYYLTGIFSDGTKKIIRIIKK